MTLKPRSIVHELEELRKLPGSQHQQLHTLRGHFESCISQPSRYVDKQQLSRWTHGVLLWELAVIWRVLIHAHSYTHIHICSHTHTHTYTHIHTNTYTHIHIHTYTHARTLKHTHIHTRTHTYTHTHTHVHTHTYAEVRHAIAQFNINNSLLIFLTHAGSAEEIASCICPWSSCTQTWWKRHELTFSRVCCGAKESSDGAGRPQERNRCEM